MKKFLITSIILLLSINVFSCICYSDYWPIYQTSNHDYFWLCINFRERQSNIIYKFQDLNQEEKTPKNNDYSAFWDNYVERKENESLKDALYRIKDQEALEYLFYLDCYINCYDEIYFYQNHSDFYYQEPEAAKEEIVEKEESPKERAIFMIDIEKDDPWYYPTKEDLINKQSNLTNIFEACQKYQGEKFLDRYTYLALRVLNANECYDSAIKFWEKNKDKISKESDVYNLCLGFYAMALYEKGERDEAAIYYASIGDINSLAWCLKDKDFDKWDKVCKKIYEYDNNAILLPYVLDRITNNTTSMDFANFAEKCSQNSKIENGQIWANASAYINILNKKYDKAKQLLDKSEKLKGDKVSSNNLRFLKLLLSTYIQKNTSEYAKYLTEELKWLETNCPSLLNKICVDRISKFYKENNNDLLSTLVMMYSHVEEDFNYYSSYDQEKESYKFLHTAIDFKKVFYDIELTALEIDSTIILKNYLNTLKNGNSLEKYIGSLLIDSDKILNEIIGTKYIRANDFDKAIEYLKQAEGIDLSISEYLPMPKLEFAQEMKKYLEEFENANEKEKYEIAYKLGEKYYLASDQGKGWALRNYYWTCGFGGLFWNKKSLKTDKNYIELAEYYLEKACQSPNTETRINANWVLAQMYLDSDIFYYDKKDDCFHYNKTHIYYQTMQKLAQELKNQKVPKHMSYCDYLLDFME